MTITIRTILMIGMLLTGALPVLGISSPASAETPDALTLRDQRGLAVERIERDLMGAYVRRDPNGKRLGTIESSPWGRYVARDSAGRRLETIEPSASGEFVRQDDAGRR